MTRQAALMTLVLMGSATRTAAQAETSGFFVSVDSDSVWVTDHVPSEPTPGAPLLLLLPGFPAADTDVLGLGQALSQRGARVLIMQPRGHGASSGVATFANALEDVDAVLEWIRSAGLDDGRGVVLGGHSWGGGISLAYAADHESVTRVLSMASSDHGVFIRRVDGDPAYGAVFREALGSLEAAAGPVRFDMEADFDELRRDWATHDLATIAPRLAGRDLLIIAGWDDELVELEYQVLPFYRALTEAGSAARIISYQDGHQFQTVREELHEAVYMWLVGGGAD